MISIPFNFYLLYNLVLFILASVILILRIKKWGVSFTFINLLKVFFKEKRLSNFTKLKILFNTFFKDLILLRRAGFLCEESFHFYGRVFLIYGFGGVVILNILNFILNPSVSTLGFLHPLSILTYLAYIIMTIGAFMLLLRRYIRINLRKTTDIGVWLMHSSLIYFGIVSILYYSAINANLSFLSNILFYFYLAGIALLYLYLPLSEVGYFIWKGPAILIHALKSESKNFR